MLNKSVVSLTIGCAALSLASVAMASGNNYYSYSEAPVPVASASPYASYSDAGIVIGVGGGYADTHWNNINNLVVYDAFGNPVVISGFSGTGFTARGFIGYDFNKFFGLEAGYTYLPKATDDFGDSITNYAIDILAKLSVPVTSGFSVHAKAGGAYLHSNLSNNSGLIIDDGSRSHFGPAFGVGAQYEIIPNLAIGVDWMRYSGQGKLNESSYQPSPDAVFLNVSYKFPVNVG